MLILVVLILINTPALASKSANYIYIDASEGNASGGHVAIRFDDDVYHYQYVDPGLIKLDKQTVNDFEFNYRFLENRSLYLSQLVISEQTYTQLRDHFDFRFQIQKQHYAISTELNREQMLLQYFSGQLISKPELLQLPGAGLFYSDQDFGRNSKTAPLVHKSADKDKGQSILAGVQQRIQSHYGKHYIEQRLQSLVKHIEKMQPTSWTELAIDQKKNQFTAMPYTFANRYLDAITAWMALNVIQQQRPLLASVYRTSDADEFSLTADQQLAMQGLSTVLQDNIINLFQSSRPDWGTALLINLGRLLVLEHSIKQQRLVVLDNTTTTYEEFDQSRVQDELHSLYQETIKSLQRAKYQFEKQDPQEIIYGQLEWQANRFLQLDKAIQGGTTVQLYSAKQIPDKPLMLPNILIPQWTEQQLNKGLQSVKKVTERYQSTLDNVYRYHLLQRNCVTELFMTIDQAISNGLSSKDAKKMTNKKIQLQSTEQLGGYVSMAPSNFIPFMSHQAVQNQYQVSEQRTLSSYRLQQLQNLYSQKNKLAVFLQESNTLSSSLYKANSADSFFVFFTDEHILLRPLYGVVNTLAGLSQSVLGLFSLPFDSGHHLQSGVRGLMMSLPELIFFNMRKGSFKNLPYSKMLAADETIIRKTATIKQHSYGWNTF